MPRLNLSCDLDRNVDESIAKQVADYMFHARNLYRYAAQSKELFNFFLQPATN